MLVEPLTVGPIVGYTTDTTCRLWGRGPEEDPDLARVFGVARATRAGTAQVVAEARFKMMAKWDYTGVGDVTALSADTAYDYQVGFVRGPADWDEIPAGTPLDWTGASAGVFRTCPRAGAAQPVSFVFGSCRYLLLKWIIHWGEESGDKAFRSILDQVDRQVRTDFLLMVGDQIYGDDLSNIDPDDHLDEFLKRYRTALSQPFIRKLMGRIPTYMILDDHEIKDAWTMDMRPGRETLYAAAMSAYQSYQVIHGPAFVPEGPDDVSRTPTRYISSPFFFPGPRQGQEARFDLAATIANPPHDFRIAAHGPIRGDDNFTRVSLDGGATTMKVEVFDRKGGLLETADLPL